MMKISMSNDVQLNKMIYKKIDSYTYSDCVVFIIYHSKRVAKCVFNTIIFK